MLKIQAEFDLKEESRLEIVETIRFYLFSLKITLEI